jgi:hypothetical protein
MGGRHFCTQNSTENRSKVYRFSVIECFRAAGGVGAVLAALVAFLLIIRKQHETDKTPTQKRLKIYLKSIDKLYFPCYDVITKGQQNNLKKINRR